MCTYIYVCVLGDASPPGQATFTGRRVCEPAERYPLYDAVYLALEI